MANRINFESASVKYKSITIVNDWELEGLRHMMSDYLKKGFKLQVDFTGHKEGESSSLGGSEGCKSIPCSRINWSYKQDEVGPSDQEDECVFSFTKNKK